MPALGRLLTVCCLAAGLCLAGCDRAGPQANTAHPMLTYLGQSLVASDATFGGTPIGGLSGISYDSGRQIYYVISDDYSANAPVRFYTVRLSLSDKGISDVAFTGVRPLLDTSGQPFARQNLDARPPVVPPDPEGVAFDAARQRLYWTSEGERPTDREPILVDPLVRIAALDGAYLGQFALPPNLAMSAQRTGPRRNRALEGLTLTPDGRSLFAAMELPGYNDGPPKSDGHQVLTRITKFDVATGEPTAQYAYPIEAPNLGAQFDGVSDLVALSDSTFLVVERSNSLPPVIRIYRAEIGAATDVLSRPSLLGGALTPMRKSLAFDVSALSVAPDLWPKNLVYNLEGITLGPKLPDGRQSVVLVSDNDFSPTQVTQFLLLAM
ncbi:phytase [Mycobacterium angelicum]|uniref:Phytase n=2 Tax=Mycobacterium angelicum TaxID=470074 RepID=A0A1W9ZPJ7_MYCAN|nr:esterase-like activity of phytase family protein [Mycobacterium angelicum]ORA19762.1 phytase [Mycobacterium angelicum]